MDTDEGSVDWLAPRPELLLVALLLPVEVMLLVAAPRLPLSAPLVGMPPGKASCVSAVRQSLAASQAQEAEPDALV